MFRISYTTEYRLNSSQHHRIINHTITSDYPALQFEKHLETIEKFLQNNNSSNTSNRRIRKNIFDMFMDYQLLKILAIPIKPSLIFRYENIKNNIQIINNITI